MLAGISYATTTVWFNMYLYFIYSFIILVLCNNVNDNMLCIIMLSDHVSI